MRRFVQFRRNESGAVLIEHTLVFILLMILTFGLIEFGIVLHQYNAAETATSAGARFIATRGPVITGISDCGVATSLTAGTRCSDVSGASGWSLTCNANAPAGNCQAAVLNALVAEMQRYNPNIEAQNVQVVLRGAGLGFVGRGAPVPMVTVRLTGMTYEYIAVGALLGIDDLEMPGFDATLVGEDLNGQGA
jgi:Flp pilus assembly pilin Flp